MMVNGPIDASFVQIYSTSFIDVDDKEITSISLSSDDIDEDDEDEDDEKLGKSNNIFIL